LGLLEDVERFSQPLPPRVELVGSESSFIYVYCIVFNREIIEEYHSVCYAYFPDFLFNVSIPERIMYTFATVQLSRINFQTEAVMEYQVWQYL